MHVNIVGAGIIGLAVAFELESRAHTVTLIDPAPGQGASYAAAGMLAPVAETVWGNGPLHQLLAASNAAYPQFIERIESATGQRPDYLQNSTLVVAAEPADREALHELAELQISLGLSAQKLLPSQARKLEPALAANIAGAVLCQDDHQVDPRSIVKILLEHLRPHLVEERAQALVTDGKRTTAVRTASGRILEAEQTIVATGLGTLDGLNELPLRPVYGDILRIQGPAGPPLITRTIRGIVHREQVYLVPRRDGSLVLGASVREDRQQAVNIGAMHLLLDNARKLVPGISDCTLNEATARARPATPDDRPLLGRLDPGLLLCTGYSRHGVLLAPLGATLTADLAHGHQSHPLHQAVDPHRFANAT
ncbi:glycine oxidase ThiO [Glutamicibacter sp. NPDC087661]|uniref:glycine oxidase ThiO n=1 Tax=Micrococcaceae TaxID=1268 RepID=UPI000CFC205C|nr:glycine oxidase ThiO [Arthrobacter sp. MYb222]PQZ87583.1 glycine oxidase ThiO [Arthrobacter sp. MYb222]